MAARETAGREASPTAGVIDSQGLKTTESGGTFGFDAGKRIKGSKRHIVVDRLGLMVDLAVQGAGVQDRDSAPENGGEKVGHGSGGMSPLRAAQ